MTSVQNNNARVAAENAPMPPSATETQPSHSLQNPTSVLNNLDTIPSENQQSTKLDDYSNPAKANSFSNNSYPPEIPHITLNMTSLNVILERIALDTFKKLKEYFKFLESSSESEVSKKKNFLEMLITFRENFVRLYVLCKWSRNHDQISKLIDLFVWLRDQNQEITNNIINFGSVKSSLISAKMPEPDLSTSLEVLLQGRPNLPTYNFLSNDKTLSPQFVYKLLHNLKVELSIKMSLQENLPKSFQKFEIKNGCVFFTVKNHFSCSISMLSDDKFHLIDFHLEFGLISNEIQPSIEKIDPKTLVTIQKYANNIFSMKDANKNGLSKLYDLLYNYSLTTKLYLIHKQLISMRMALWRGHLTHNYNAESSSITITYWAQRKYTKTSTIQLSILDQENGKILDMKWFKDGKLDESHNLTSLLNGENINVLNLINSIIKYHIKSLISNLEKSLINSVFDIEKMISISSDSEKLIFKISQSKEIVYGIDSLSGSSYFENPTNIMNRSAFKINTGNGLDFIEILKLKMLIQESAFSSMMNATGWVNLKSVRLNPDELFKLNINYSNLKNKSLSTSLTSIDIYRRKDWPIGWAILVGSFGFQSNVQLWCSKIQSIEGQWIINWCNEINLNELNNEESSISMNSKLANNENDKLAIDSDNDIYNNTSSTYSPKSLMYNHLINLIKISSSKLISNLIVKELKDQGCELKVLNSSDKMVNEFLISNFQVDNMNLTSTDSAVLLIKNKSLFHIKSAKDSLVLLITIKNSDLKAKMYGKLNSDDSGVKNLPDIKYSDENSTTLNYDSNTKIFQIESEVDLSNQFGPVMNNSGSNTTNNSDDNLILLNILSFLKKFARTLNLLKSITSNATLIIKEVSSDSVTFKYGENDDEFLTLKISQNQDNISMELPENNPHNYCLPYLNEIIVSDQLNNVSIKEIVLYLRLTLKFSRKIQDLLAKSKVDLDNFNKQNALVDYEKNPDELQNMPNFGFIPFVCNLESLRISYFKYLKVETQTSTGKKKNTKVVSDIFKFEIKIDLRHRSDHLSKKKSKYFISLGDVRTETTGKVESLSSITTALGTGKALTDLAQNLSNILGKYFNGEEFPTSLNNGSVVFLKDGLCCDFENIDSILEDLHNRLHALISN